MDHCKSVFSRQEVLITIRLRIARDVNQYLIRYWQLVTGRFVPRNPNIGICYTLGVDDEKIERALLHEEYKLLCINDNPQLAATSVQKTQLLNVLERFLPVKSFFEV